MQLPTLYKRTSTGALQEWTVIVDGEHYWTRFGQTGGDLQVSARTRCERKNVGRANETSAKQQAEFEAKALWEKKLKKDYTTDPEVEQGQKSHLIEGGILPMLAHKFSEHGDKLKYPCFVQPKLDGHRCTAIHPGGGEQSYGLWSRTRKPIKSMEHIVHTLDWLECGGLPFDGELYNHEYRDKFEKLTHFIRQSKPEPGSEVVQFHVYDMPLPYKTFRERLAIMRRYLSAGLGPMSKANYPLRLVETREVQNEEELMLAFEDFRAQGYEGAIARNADGLYVNKRSTDLLKIKEFDDDEFMCVGVEEGKGKMAGHAIFVCVTKAGTNFKAKMKGDHDALVKYFKDPKLVYGRMVTVKYQGLTNKNGVPRFPVALRIRTDI